MQKPSSFYEIELKAILTPEDYQRLYDELPQRMRLINEETIHTTRYRPGDIRLRHSDRTLEIVCKQADVTRVSRKEVRIPLATREKLDYFAQLLELSKFHPDPPWTKHKREFEYPFQGFTYIVCLQHIKNFAYILEVEFLSETDDAATHEPNLKAILTELGCEVINPPEFHTRIEEYIATNK